MSTFFLIVVSNIFVAAIFYLILSLKLEKKASTYQSEKLKGEMDEVIREFNLTAERNISLLENRIKKLTALLEKNGIHEGLDIKVEDEKAPIRNRGENKQSISATRPEKKEPISSSAENEKVVTTSFDLKNVFKKIQNRVEGKLFHSDNVKDEKTISKKPSKIDFKLDEKIEIPLEEESDQSYDLLKEEEVKAMIMDSDDNFELLSRLYLQGYSIEFLSDCSGIPAGEISLILNLNNNNF